MEENDLSFSSIEFSSSDEEAEEQESLASKIERITPTLPVDQWRNDPYNYMMDGLLIAIQVLCMLHIWPASALPAAQEDGDELLYHKLLYAHRLKKYEFWQAGLQKCIATRLSMFIQDMLQRVETSPVFDIVRALEQYSTIYVLRKIKRFSIIDTKDMRINPFRRDAADGNYINCWTGERKTVKVLQQVSDVQVNEQGKPIIVRDETGTERILTVKREDAIEGDNEDRDKILIIVPKPSDIDPDAPIDSLKDLLPDEQHTYMADEMQGNIPALGTGLPPPVQVVVPGVIVPYLCVLQNFIHFEKNLHEKLLMIVDDIAFRKTCKTFPEAWKNLVGEKNANVPSIINFTKSTKFSKLVCIFRDQLLNGVESMQCDACKSVARVDSSWCSTCESTIRSCHQSKDCADKAAAKHSHDTQVKKKAKTTKKT
jgi:hypothetical protein